MAAKIEFTAVTPEGETVTRTSGTMPYVAYAGGTWHKSFASAHKAATDRYHAPGTKVVPVQPTKIIGKITAEDVADIREHGWGDIDRDVLVALYEAKLAGKSARKQATEVMEAEVEQFAADVEEWEYVAPEGAVAESVGTIVGGTVEFEEIAPEPVAEKPAPVKASAEPTLKLRITSRVSAWLVTVERTEVEAGIIAKMAAARKRTDGSVTIATTQVERDTLLAHCSDMETANLEGAGFHDLDRLNKVNAARWLIGKIAEAEA